ncbi:MAG: adenylosuccinate lyase, partial [Chitinophagales bacterium]|nr:adenylosuccinate lyase [Chitinophagales bacterium]
MNSDGLLSISPVDGRYQSKTAILSNYFSEHALFKYRLKVEVEYLIALANRNIGIKENFNDDLIAKLRNLYESFSVEDALSIKSHEKITNHDVKAVEYFLKDKLKDLGLASHLEFVHFGLTSQDINNTAVPLLLMDAHNMVMYPALKKLLDLINDLAKSWSDIPMLARTHGQPASPTTVGKEFFVFAERLQIQIKALSNIPFTAKFGGATGNFNAHLSAFPDIDWIAFSNDFLQSIKLKRQQTTTQIEHYDNLAALLDNYKRINTILIDLAQDVWLYIAMDYFKQEIKKGEVGSSTMPHKVNPIDFENAEGNLALANALFEFMSRKLPISRLQRDLTDSTVSRNLGVPFAHVLIALLSLEKGLNKLRIDKSKIESDLEKNWAVVAEAIQTILRREGYPNPYEALKDLTRSNNVIDKDAIQS